jgi:hypothetical protein
MIRTEDGVEVAMGDRVYNYYDRKPGVITSHAHDGWFDVKHDDGTFALLDGSRICSIAFAERKGWL